MLHCLRVANFAIIDHLEVEFDPGLNVVTGETGAGKSILVNALQLVLGARGQPEVVRSGAEAAEVEALFDIADDPGVKAKIEAAGLGRQDELVLRRIIQKGGRTRAYVNGRLASATQLSDLSLGLANISSQHEHHSLVDPVNHLQLLDAFAELYPLRDQMRSCFGDLNQTLNSYQKAIQNSHQRVEREDLLRYQISEIEELSPGDGEFEQLREEREVQRNAERLTSLTGDAEYMLYTKDGALCEMLSRITDQVRDASEIDPHLSQLAEQLASAQIQLEDAAHELGSYTSRLNADPDRLAEIEERLNAIDTLQRKYGGSIASMLEFQQKAMQELDELTQGEEHIAHISKALEEAQRAVQKVARKLSAQRKKAAGQLSQAISRELASLGMGDAQVTVEVEPTASDQSELSVDGARLFSTGIDRVEFLIATNRGEKPQPLHKIASGGELSRAMLAVKRVLTGLGPAGLYVFDEVDAGIGGAIAEVIGRKLHQISRHHQVICITHLPQIAIYGDSHFQVRKQADQERTQSLISRLNKKQRREEIARMLGGIEITDKIRATANEMLRAVHEER